VAWGAFASQQAPPPFQSASPYSSGPYGAPAYLGGYAPARPGTNGLAVASFVCGLAFFCGITAPAAVVLGHVALSQIKRTGESGRGLAIAGLVLGYLVIAGWVTLVVIGITTGSGTTGGSSGSSPL
jgi:hypothetical protein